MTHNCIFFLYISGGFIEIEETVSSVIRIILLTIIVIWPFFMTAFLYFKRKRLDEHVFKQKIIAMYNGINTKKFTALMYTSLFCIRRLLLVCALLVLQLVLQLHGFWLILVYNGLQSLYFWYMTSVRPHEETIHNKLEYFNELCVITMQYCMIYFISGSGVDPKIQWNIGIAAMVLVGFVFLVNMIALFYLTITRAILWFKRRAMRKRVFRLRKASVQTAADSTKLNQGINLSIESNDQNSVLSGLEQEIRAKTRSMLEQNHFNNAKIEGKLLCRRSTFDRDELPQISEDRNQNVNETGLPKIILTNTVLANMRSTDEEDPTLILKDRRMSDKDSQCVFDTKMSIVRNNRPSIDVDFMSEIRARSLKRKGSSMPMDQLLSPISPLCTNNQVSPTDVQSPVQHFPLTTNFQQQNQPQSFP